MFESYDQEIGMLTNNTTKKLMHYLNCKLEEFQLTTEQWLVLMNLSKQNRINQRLLAEVSNKDQSTLTRILDILERKHFIGKESSKDDRRSFVVYITEEGLKISKEVSPFLEEVFQGILLDISEERLRIYSEVLLQIDNNIDHLK